MDAESREFFEATTPESVPVVYGSSPKSKA
jgi:hypothetical protein